MTCIHDLPPELSLYRLHTKALLRRYMHMSMELGRLPSLLGREFFRSRCTSYRMSSFEDVVIFVHDVERCLQKLDPAAQQLIARVVLQEHSYNAAARLLNIHPRTVVRRVPEALDTLTEIFLHTGLLRIPQQRRQDAEAPAGLKKHPQRDSPQHPRRSQGSLGPPPSPDVA